MAGLGCRRFMKLLTDAWFPAPKSGINKKRKVTDAHVKNRFWAHLSDNLKLGSKDTERFGTEFENLWELASKYLHENNPKKDEVYKLLTSILSLVSRVISVNIDAASRPYAAYSDSIKSCLLYTSPSPRDGLLSRMPSSA